MGDEQEILAGNLAFYAAFNAQDADSMALLWAEQAECVCLHPGSVAIHGRTAILRSWRAILGSRGAPHIDIESARVVMLGEAAMVLCCERVGDRSGTQSALLAATNVFVREQERWRMVHHHASPVGHVVDASDGVELRTLN
jgi:uncharacterized protein (TIGR02246 family)